MGSSQQGASQGGETLVCRRRRRGEHGTFSVLDVAGVRGDIVREYLVIYKGGVGE